MPNFIEMPKLSDTMTVGTVANWLKAEGDAIESGDVIAEIETDKATMELEAFEDGILLKQIAKAGDQVPIGEPIAAIGEEGETVEVPSKPSASQSESENGDGPEPNDGEAAAAENEAASAELAKEPSESLAESHPPAADARVKASPLAKKLAGEKGIDLKSLKGSGPNGRIVKKDVLASAQEGSAGAGSLAPAESGPIASNPIAQEADLPVSSMRSVIATRLVESKTTAPHFYLQAEINAASLLATRAKINADLSALPEEVGGGVKLTVNDFILKASAEALRRVPAMNRSWQGNTIHQSGAVNLAFGVAIDDGLLTPVVRNAESKTLKQIAAEAKELIGKARSKKLSPAEMTGSTFTVTNLGMFGVSSFYGIINTPNAGILSVGATENKPIVNEAGEIVAGQVMNVGISCDHRVVDGAIAAQYLQQLRILLETPALALV